MKKTTPNAQLGKGFSLDEQIRYLRTNITGLRESYTDLFGPTKGTISNTDIAREIASLEATVNLLKALKPLRKTFAFIRVHSRLKKMRTIDGFKLLAA